MVLWRAVSTSDILAALARFGVGRSTPAKNPAPAVDSRVVANSDLPPRR